MIIAFVSTHNVFILFDKSKMKGMLKGNQHLLCLRFDTNSATSSVVSSVDISCELFFFLFFLKLREALRYSISSVVSWVKMFCASFFFLSFLAKNLIFQSRHCQCKIEAEGSRQSNIREARFVKKI